MKRRNLLVMLGGLSATGLLVSRVPAWAASDDAPAMKGAEPPYDLSELAWKKRLSSAAYAVLFKHATERPGSSPLDQEKRKGQFICAACYFPLFSSAHKYDSGTGWPSFWQPLEGSLGTQLDFKLITPRTEYHCIRCKGHQGHVFEDGPQPTGLRYCNNGVALKFVLEGDAVPEWPL